MTTARRAHNYEGEFPMHRGGSLRAPVIAYETWGELAPGKDNAIILFTGLSPSAHASSSAQDPAPGWWEQMVGPGRPIDTQRFFVVCLNSLGSCFGSTGPASIDPASGEPYRLSFPVLSIEDIARGGRAVMTHLGVERSYATVGCSMGGLTALAFAAMFPEASARLISVSSSAHSLPFAIALRSLQRELIRTDSAWQGGNYPSGGGPILGMRLARKLGMITYRSAAEWEQRFGRERVAAEHSGGDVFGIDFEVESYLQNHAEKFTGQFDANCYLYLSRATDLFDLAEHGGSLARSLARIQVEQALVVGVSSDFLFPIAQQEALARGLEEAGRDVEFVALDSIQGHDAFLVDMDRFRPVFCNFLGTCG